MTLAHHHRVSNKSTPENKLAHQVRALKTLSTCNQVLIHASEELECIQQICQILITVGGYCLAWVGFAEVDEARHVRPVAQAGFEPGYLETLDLSWSDTERGHGPIGTAIRTGKPIITHNILSNPVLGSWHAEALKYGYASSIALPLQDAHQRLGTLNIYASEPDAFDFDKVKQLTELADNLSYSIGALRIRTNHHQTAQELEHHIEQLAILNRITNAANSTLNLDRLLEKIYHEITATLKADAFFIALYSAKTNELDYRIRIDDGIREPAHRRCAKPGLTTQVITAQKPLHIHDWEQEKESFPAPHAWGSMRLPRTWLGVPMKIGADVIGVICLQSYQPNAYDDKAERLLVMIADQVAMAVHNARVFESEQIRRAKLAGLYGFTKALADANDTETILNLTTSYSVNTIGITFASIALLENNSLAIRARYQARVLPGDPSATPPPLPEGDTFIQRLVRHGAPVILSANQSMFSKSECDALLLNNAQTLCITPLRTGNHILGLLILGEARSQKRAPLTPEQVRLASNIAEQSASALHRAMLRKQTEQHTIALALAHDATIEGWSRALDLRDRETEGHTQRVTELALQVAQTMGIDESQIIHIRRGALLHDIGKLGIPDSILFKPGPLNDEEWKTMRKHPEYARELIEPIAYLQPALDIPYAHHEKWDGSGYPRGLAREKIPLAARIFTIVDVWDALCSDRPYRAAWQAERVREYIRAASNSHFDPHIVDVFLSLINK